MPILILTFFVNLSLFLLYGTGFLAFLALVNGTLLVLRLNAERLTLTYQRDRP